MGILLVVMVVIVLIAIAVRALKSYEAELRRNPSAPAAGETADTFLYAEAGDPGSSDHTSGHSLHHVDPGCPDSHHEICDVGGHSGFDIGHGGFDGGGHH